MLKPCQALRMQLLRGAGPAWDGIRCTRSMRHVRVRKTRFEPDFFRLRVIVLVFCRCAAETAGLAEVSCKCLGI